MTRPNDTELSAEALEAAVDFLWPHYCDDKLPKMQFARSDQRCQNLALALDRFRVAGVRAGVEKAADFIKEDALSWPEAKLIQQRLAQLEYEVRHLEPPHD